mmetsp:Transcript_46940/g.73479  ORF Transcript_46940/g.73479 Transcript_46940/m.73479 type:complete len:85 (-) Transcript_46940:71-325(-)
MDREVGDCEFRELWNRAPGGWARESTVYEFGSWEYSTQLEGFMMLGRDYKAQSQGFRKLWRGSGKGGLGGLNLGFGVQGSRLSA